MRLLKPSHFDFTAGVQGILSQLLTCPFDIFRQAYFEMYFFKFLSFRLTAP